MICACAPALRIFFTASKDPTGSGNNPNGAPYKPPTYVRNRPATSGRTSLIRTETFTQTTTRRVDMMSPTTESSDTDVEMQSVSKGEQRHLEKGVEHSDEEILSMRTAKIGAFDFEK